MNRPTPSPYEAAVPRPKTSSQRSSVDAGYRSLWIEQARASGGDPLPPLHGPLTTSICIVGGGFTGLWTALHVKALEPERDVVLLEADRCGSGASGRNGGFVMSWWSKFAALAGKCGTDDALWLAQQSANSIEAIGAFCERAGIGDWFQHRGWLWIATNSAQEGAWASTVELLDAAGAHPFETVDRDAAVQRSGSPCAKAAVFERSCATVQPAMLAAALRRAIVDAGVRVHEGSPMLAIEHGDRPRVRTRSGEVTAERVVLTLGSWTPTHVPAARRGLIVVGSDVITTPPVGELLDEIGVEPGLAISDSRLMVDYFHRTHDDRMVLGVGGSSLAFRGRVGAKFHGETRRAAGVRRQLVRLYPQLEATAEEMNWTGPVDRSVSGLPFIHRDGRVLICAGFSGNGVGPSHLAARIVASHALGVDDRYARCGLVAPPDGGFPPEPFRYLGGKLVRLAVARKERTDDREQVSDPITRWFANLAPAGLVPTEKV